MVEERGVEERAGGGQAQVKGVAQVTQRGAVRLEREELAKVEGQRVRHSR